jgi:hypothetical protein
MHANAVPTQVVKGSVIYTPHAGVQVMLRTRCVERFLQRFIPSVWLDRPGPAPCDVSAPNTTLVM